MTFTRFSAVILLLLVAGTAGMLHARTGHAPSHKRAWIEPHSILPAVQVEGERVTIHGVRDFRWRSASDYDPHWETRTYDLTKIQRVWFGLSPFARGWRGPAHAFLSFEFADSRFVTVSVEARREIGEEYGVVAGLLNRFEVIYVIGDERDVIGLRTNVWGDPVHLYPIETTPDRVRQVFLAMVERAEEIRQAPEFYNTFVHNCTSALLKAANEAREEPIPFGIDIILPGYADHRLHRLGLIDTELPLEWARTEFLINARANAAPLTERGFSRRIREG